MKRYTRYSPLVSTSRVKEFDKVATLAGMVPHPAAQSTAFAIKAAGYIGRNVTVKRTFTPVRGHWRRTCYGRVRVRPHKRRIR